MLKNDQKPLKEEIKVLLFSCLPVSQERTTAIFPTPYRGHHSSREQENQFPGNIPWCSSKLCSGSLAIDLRLNLTTGSSFFFSTILFFASLTIILTLPSRFFHLMCCVTAIYTDKNIIYACTWFMEWQHSILMTWHIIMMNSFASHNHILQKKLKNG
mgnify:CR=1 FL=1